jgi:alpha-maltose-1-phosphate synthase
MSDPRLSVVHHGNAANARQTAIAFDNSNLLHSLITTIAYKPESKKWRCLDFLPQSLNKLISQELSKRTWEIHHEKIITYPWYEILRLLLLKTKFNKLFTLTSNQLTNNGFRILDILVSKYNLHNISAIYIYEDLAATTFTVAKEQNILCLYDLPIPFYQTIHKIMEEEATLFSSLRESIQSVNEPKWKLERKQKEIELADHIFVASSVTQKSLIDAGIDSHKISIIPYGAPVEIFQPQTKDDELFRVLFVGKISPLKGVHYLLKAWREIQLKNAELLLIGDNHYPVGWLERDYLGLYQNISSVSHFSLNKYYTQASVLVLPSLIDGFGLVVLEAMACGIPVVVTINTGSSDIITDGVDGFIIPIRDVESLKQKLKWCYSHPHELAKMGQAARHKAEQLNWGLYRQRLVDQTKKILQI